MNRKNKIQQLLISELLESGYIQLTLPDGLILELGTVQEDKVGNLVKQEDYCWIIASQDDRTVSMNSYNLGLSFNNDADKIIFEDQTISKDGEKKRTVSVV